MFLFLQVEMVNEIDDPALKKRKTTPSRRLSDLESSVASSGPHEAVALLATFFPPVGGHWPLRAGCLARRLLADVS